MAQKQLAVRPNRAAQPPDADLVVRVRGGDVAAFELLMRRYNQRLYRLARGILKDPAEAEDVVQETYLRAYTRLESFIGPDGFAVWLARIASNEALGRLRRRGRVVSLDDHVLGARDGAREDEPMETLGSQRPDPERAAASAELGRLLERAVDALPADFRSVFVLRAIESLSVAETAACLEIRPETVKTRYHRARRLLQEALGERMETLMPALFPFAGARCDRMVATVLARIEPHGPAGDERAPSPAQPAAPPARHGAPIRHLIRSLFRNLTRRS